ncbi:hypothetical protein ACTPEU_00495, partial [Clostridioides difficile]
AYIIALLINQVGSLVLGTGGSIAGAIISIFIAVAVVFVVLTYSNKNMKKEKMGKLSYMKN